MPGRQSANAGQELTEGATSDIAVDEFSDPISQVFAQEDRVRCMWGMVREDCLVTVGVEGCKAASFAGRPVPSGRANVALASGEGADAAPLRAKIRTKESRAWSHEYACESLTFDAGPEKSRKRGKVGLVEGVENRAGHLLPGTLHLPQTVIAAQKRCSRDDDGRSWRRVQDLSS